MTCDRMFDLATAFLDGTLDADARAAVAGHMATCADCRKLIASLSEAPAEDHALTFAILERTTGPVCESARERLGAWVDGTLEPLEAAQVRGHLDHCAECAALGRVLLSLKTKLPLLAEAMP